MSTIRERLANVQNGNDSIRGRLKNIENNYSPTVQEKYKLAKEKQETAKKNLNTALEEKGIVTSDSLYSTPNLFSIRDRLKEQRLSKNSITLEEMNYQKNDNSFNVEKRNIDKYNDALLKEDVQEKVNILNQARNQSAIAKYELNQEEVNSKDTTFMSQLLSPLRGAASMVLKENEMYQNENGDWVRIPSQSELRQQKIVNDTDSTLGKMLITGGYEVGKQLVSTALNSIAPGLGQVAYFTNIYTDQYNNSLADGYTENEAVAYASLGSALELVTGKILGGTSKMIFGKSSDLSKTIQAGLKEIIKSPRVSSFLSNATSEGIEEFVQEYIDGFNRRLTLGSEEKVFTKETFKEALFSAGIGAITGGASGIISPDIDNTQIEQQNSNELTNSNMNSTNTTTNTLNSLQVPENGSNQMYQYKESDNQKINNLRRTAVEVGKFVNNEKTNRVLNVAEKIINEKGYNIIFDNNITNPKGNFVNANISSDGDEITIRLNPNSERSAEFLIIHEISHGIKTQEMINLVNNYAQKNPEFNQAIKSLEETYGKDLASEEVFADVCGQLFGNQEFINNLSIEKPSLFRQIYNKIIEWANKLSGNSNETLFMKDLKNKWENAYRSSNELNNTSNYSVETLKNGVSFVQMENDLFLNDDGSKMTDKEIYNTLIGKEIILNDGIKAKIINRLPNKSMYNELFKRYPTYQNVNDIKTVNSNINKNIEELLSNSDNISPNEPDYKGRHLQQGINSFDTRRVSFYDGNQAYDLDLSIAKLVDGTYIAYAKRNLVPNNNLLQDIKKEKSMSKSQLASLDTDNISQQNINVNDKLSTKYSMQETKNNTPELENSSFSLEEKAKRYDDLSKTNKIEYFRKDNGDVRVYLIDTNNNLVNQLDVWSSTEAIRQFGEKIGNHLFETANDDTQYLNIGNDINNTGTETDYFMNHRPTKTGLTADNLTNQNSETPMPKDMYDHPEWYFQMNEKYSKESMDVVRKIKGKPEADITIYRATSGNKINPGDWVTLSKSYAEQHNKSQYDGKGNVVEMKVKAKDVQYAGDDINEFGYWPNGNEKYSIANITWQEHLEKNYKSSGTTTKFSEMRADNKEQNNSETKNKNILATENNVKQSKKKIQNPVEISKIKKEEANTTPLLKGKKVTTGDGKSKFANNILEKTNMLSDSSKEIILSDDDVKFYKKVTNEESLKEAYSRLNENGKSEVESWLGKDSENASSVDVAEGWILLKQYQDNIAKESDLTKKDELNRSMVQVAKKMREIGTKAGQTVQAYNILSRLTPEGMYYYAQSELSNAWEQMRKGKTLKWINENKNKFEITPEETDFIMNTMKEVSTMEDGYEKQAKLAEIQKLLTDKLPPEKGAGIKAWMRISMLFNPKTQIRNVLGNAVITPVNVASDVIASSIDKVISKKTGVRTTGTLNTKSYSKGFKEGLYRSYNDFKKGINTRNMEGNRFEVTQGKSFNDNTKLGKTLNKTDQLLSFMLDVGDRGFYESAFTNSLNNQLVLNNTKEVTQDMIDIATSEALSRTWQDNNEYTKFVLNARKGLNNLASIKGYGLGDVLIPFAKTPANLTKAIVEYSPAGLIKALNSGKKLKNALSTNQYNAKMQHEFVQSLGKATAGTLLYVLGYALAKSGVTSGESDDDKDVANFLKNTLGINSYSIKIGDKTFTYDWAQPIAAPLAITSNIVQKEKEGATLLENIISSLDTGLNVLFEQSFLESMKNILSQPGEIGTKIFEQLTDLPARAVPTLLKQIVDLTDSTQRTTYEYNQPLKTAVNKVVAKIPVASKLLEPTVDTLGREVLRYGGKNNLFNVFLNPANVITVNISESAQEIYDVYKATGDKTIMPRVIPYYFNKDGEKIILSTKERVEFQKRSGKIIEDNVKKLNNNPYYKKMSNTEKADVINKIVNYSYNKARKEVLGVEMDNDYNKVNEWVENGGTVYDYYSNKKENDYSLENPKKYKTITSFGVDYYDYTEYQKEVTKIKEKYSGEQNKDKRKQKIFEYINSLPLRKTQKILIYNLTGNYSIKDNQEEIFNYINSLDISKKEKQEIWNYIYD